MEEVDPAGAADVVAGLYRRYRSPLVWHLRARGATEAEAHDAVQEAFMAALRAGSIDDPSAWYGWLRTVATRSLARARNAAGGGRWAVETMAPGDLPDRPTAAPDVADTVEARSRESYVLALLDTLPPRPRAVLCLRLEGLSTAEIAAELGLEQPAVRQNLSRARRSLRALIVEGDEHEP